MCRVCTKARTLPPKEAIALIADAIKEGKKHEHFEKVMDQILGTEEPVTDKELDKAWEDAHRPGQ